MALTGHVLVEPLARTGRVGRGFVRHDLTRELTYKHILFDYRFSFRIQHGTSENPHPDGILGGEDIVLSIPRSAVLSVVVGTNEWLPETYPDTKAWGYYISGVLAGGVVQTRRTQKLLDLDKADLDKNVWISFVMVPHHGLTRTGAPRATLKCAQEQVEAVVETLPQQPLPSWLDNAQTIIKEIGDI